MTKKKETVKEFVSNAVGNPDGSVTFHGNTTVSQENGYPNDIAELMSVDAGRKWTKCDECELECNARPDGDCSICNALILARETSAVSAVDGEGTPQVGDVIKLKKVKKPKVELTEDQKVVMFGSLNADILNAIKKLVDKSGLVPVLIEDRLIEGYLAQDKKSPEISGEARSLADFVADDNNRKDAKEKAKKLYEIITGTPDLGKYAGHVFTKRQIVQKTTLTNSQTDEMLKLFKAFGLIEFTKGSHEFIFHFSDEEIRKQSIEEANKTIDIFKANISAFIGFVKSSSFLSSEDKKEIIYKTKEKITDTLFEIGN